MPDNKLTTTPKPANARMILRLKFTLRSLPESSLNNGSASFTISTDTNNDKNTSSVDSVRNNLMSAHLPEPITFRMPTSFARLYAPAVDRLMKLIAATTSINMAITLKIYTYITFPLGNNSAFERAYKCIDVSGCSKKPSLLPFVRNCARLMPITCCICGPMYFSTICGNFASSAFTLVPGFSNK